MYFRGIIVILQRTRDQTAKRTSLLNSERSKTLEEYKRKNSTIHMYGTIHGYGTVYVTVHDTVHIDGLMTWH